MSKVHRTKEENTKLIRHITTRFIPYEELAEVLRNDGEAFLEDDEERPLRRQTMWNAAKKLSKMIGKKVRYDRALLQVEGVANLEGYSLALEEESSSESSESSKPSES